MMNPYNGYPYRFSGRSGRDFAGGGNAPYRRPMSRGNLPSYPSVSENRSMPRGGCGCGIGQETSRNGDRQIQHGSVGEQRRTVPATSNGGCGCGENGGAPASCKKLMEQIRAVDFALYEVILYLDVYPHSCDALETYHKLKAQSESLRKEYESACGPLTAFGNESGASWDWTVSPFPWEFDAE